MPPVPLTSQKFRREREDTWRELEGLVAKAERGGLGRLDSGELLRLPVLYRATVSSLSVARAISLDRNLTRYLEGLSSRAYFLVYGTRASVTGSVAGFFLRRFPAAVRAARWHLIAAAAALALGAATAFTVVTENQEWFYTFVPADLASGRTPAASTAALRRSLAEPATPPAERLWTFATFLFTHNARIGMLAFALGFAFGVPTLVLLFYNGLVLGGFAALYASRGLALELGGWLAVHGTTELLAIALCGAAGLRIGASLAFPGRYGRLEMLARSGRQAGGIVLGAVALFLVAGLLESFARQLVVDTTLRYAIGGGALLLWGVWFLAAGRGRGGSRDGG